MSPCHSKLRAGGIDENYLSMRRILARCVQHEQRGRARRRVAGPRAQRIRSRAFSAPASALPELPYRRRLPVPGRQGNAARAVRRTGRGAVANECSSCHQKTNLPASYGEHAPPGSPGWRLPPPETKMIFNGVTARELCRTIKDRRATGGRNLASMLAHIRSNKQVAWGWAPGANRATPPASRAETVAAFKTW